MSAAAHSPRCRSIQGRYFGVLKVPVMSGSSDIEDHEGSSVWNQSAKGPAAGSGAGEGQDRDNDASGSGLTPLCQSAMHVSLWRLASERASQNTATVIFTAAAIVSGSCQPTSRRHAVG